MGRKSLLVLVTLLLGVSSLGCSSLGYYRQAIGGHLALLNQRQPIDEVLGETSTPSDLRERLLRVQEVLRFAREELHLEDHGSYHHYVHVEGRYVVWNVVAAPRYSVEARTWCYPFAGCASYRGYYAKQDAVNYAQGLEAQGLDVAVLGAAAYSTLGWLSDPVLSTMLYRDDARLVEVLVHELAHQRVYVADHTLFNEGFANTVAREGVRRWFASHGDGEAYAGYLQERQFDRDFNALLLTARQYLADLYASGRPGPEMAAAKRATFVQLQADYRRFKQAHGGRDDYDGWMARDLNNAHLALLATYTELEPLFQSWIDKQGGDMEAFYAEVASYAQHPERIDALVPVP